jgi:hypothetical protein
MACASAATALGWLTSQIRPSASPPTADRRTTASGRIEVAQADPRALGRLNTALVRLGSVDDGTYHAARHRLHQLGNRALSGSKRSLAGVHTLQTSEYGEPVLPLCVLSDWQHAAVSARAGHSGPTLDYKLFQERPYGGQGGGRTEYQRKFGGLKIPGTHGRLAA